MGREGQKLCEKYLHEFFFQIYTKESSKAFVIRTLENLHYDLSFYLTGVFETEEREKLNKSSFPKLRQWPGLARDE